MTNPHRKLPEGEFRKNANRDDKGPNAAAPAPKGPKIKPGAESTDWSDMDRKKQEKIQRG